MSQHPASHRPPTIVTVADAAGVSPMTVSKVLRGTGRISAATRERVLKVADTLGYVPNGLAGALASQHSQIVGVLIPSIGDMVYSGVLLAGINSVLVPRPCRFHRRNLLQPRNRGAARPHDPVAQTHRPQS
ncbi:MAG: LacI family DNA-binding transcriptional regulator [Paracoccaceae bacterium]